MSHHTHDTLDCPGCDHDEIKEPRTACNALSSSGRPCTQYGGHGGDHSHRTPDGTRVSWPVAKEEAPPVWLDKPTRDGYWIRSHEGKLSDVLAVRGELAVGPNPAGGVHVGQFKGSKWFFACAFPTPPPPPLPKSKQVTMTARVEKVKHTPEWRVRVVCDAFPEQLRLFRTRESAVAWVRENYGVEPEIEVSRGE